MDPVGAPDHECNHSPVAADRPSTDAADKTSTTSTTHVGGTSEGSRYLPEPSPEHPSSLNSIEALTTVNYDGVSQPPAMWGNHLLNVVRKIVPDESLHPGEFDVAQAYAGPLNPVPTSLSTADLTSWKSDRDTTNAKSDFAQGAVIEHGVIRVDCAASKAEKDVNDNNNNGDGLLRRDSETEKTRAIAAQALDAIPEVKERTQLPSDRVIMPSKSSKREFRTDSDKGSSSAPSPKVLRSPIWRSLVPTPAPAEGYWTPSATEEGEKNTPMCPPCRTGKKGRCYGGLTGLPCDRCMEKGYSKERCEGSLVFRFSPRTKRSKKEVETTVKTEAKDGARLKRDAFGRFV